jgi:hypothetical protein
MRTLKQRELPAVAGGYAPKHLPFARRPVPVQPPYVDPTGDFGGLATPRPPRAIAMPGGSLG